MNRNLRLILSALLAVGMVSPVLAQKPDKEEKKQPRTKRKTTEEIQIIESDEATTVAAATTASTGRKRRKTNTKSAQASSTSSSNNSAASSSGSSSSSSSTASHPTLAQRNRAFDQQIITALNSFNNIDRTLHDATKAQLHTRDVNELIGQYLGITQTTDLADYLIEHNIAIMDDNGLLQLAPNYQDADCNTILHLVPVENNPPLLQSLVDLLQAADIDINNGSTPLYTAMVDNRRRKNSKYELFEDVMRKHPGINLNGLTNSNHQTPLMLLYSVGQDFGPSINEIKHILNAANSQEVPPLITFLRRMTRNDYRSVKLLSLLQDTTINQCLNISVWWESPYCWFNPAQERMESGGHHVSLLEWAAQYRLSNVVAELIKHGANIRQCSRQSTLLHRAITSNDHATVKHLIEAGANVHALRKHKNESALHLATRVNNPKIINYLINKGILEANENEIDDDDLDDNEIDEDDLDDADQTTEIVEDDPADAADEDTSEIVEEDASTYVDEKAETEAELTDDKLTVPDDKKSSEENDYLAADVLFESIMHQAAESEFANYAAIQQLLSGGISVESLRLMLTARDRAGRTLLHHAVLHLDLNLIKVTVEYYKEHLLTLFDFNAIKDNKGKTPAEYVMHAMSKPDNDESTEEILYQILTHLNDASLESTLSRSTNQN